MQLVRERAARAIRPAGYDVSGLFVFLLITLGVGGVAGWMSRGAGTVYAELATPFWAPPAWLFAPVWTLLYISMAVAAWFVWRARPWDEAWALLVPYATQLVLNGAWSPIFFTLEWRGAALFWILLLDGAIAWTMVWFAWASRTAMWLFLPYAIWAGFATLLNAAIWWLNL